MDSRPLRRLCSGLGLLVLLAGWAQADDVFSVSAPTFKRGMPIPVKYGYHQQNISPELRIADVPAQARSLVLIVDDPDSPSGLWTHWLLWNVPPGTTDIAEGQVPANAVQGKNNFGNVRYDGPTPPLGMHRYYFHLSALDTTLSLPAGSTRADLQKAAQGHVLQETETFGTYRSGLTLAR